MKEQVKIEDEQLQQMMKQYHQAHTPWRRSNKQYRNQPCRCGSGKKTKNCCGLDNKYELDDKGYGKRRK